MQGYHFTPNGIFPLKIFRQDHARRLVTEGRATLFTAADYRPGKGIDLAVTAILDRIEATARIRQGTPS